MSKKIFILLGLPGSGKGTQGELLSKELLIPHISTGDIFRKMIQKDLPEAILLNEYMSAGELVPSDLVNKIVRSYILSDECRNGCILDGYPRNLSQAEYFIENVDANIIAILFDTTDEVVKKRILGRFSCSNCGKIYNKFFHLPKKKNFCDVCHGKNFNHRSDDDDKTIIKRIEAYREKTLPLIEYYYEKSKLFKINASNNTDKIFEELMSFVKKV